MKIWLDDIRNAPDGWVWVKSVMATIRLLKTGQVKKVSLDHDLGKNRQAGSKVTDWIEEQTITKGFRPPKILIHSANYVGRFNMKSAIARINRVKEIRKAAEKNKFNEITTQAIIDAEFRIGLKKFDTVNELIKGLEID